MTYTFLRFELKKLVSQSCFAGKLMLMKKTPLKRAIICLDGEPPSKDTFQKVLRTDDDVIAADGGANWLSAYGIQPRLLIGDLDGVQTDILRQMPESMVLQIQDQYSTDLEKALSWVIANKYTQVVLLGMGGKRIDHILSNFSLIWKFEKKISIEMIHDDWSAYLLQNTKKKFDVRTGQTVSLIPFSNCSGITLRGLQYPLTNKAMKLGNVGISNVAVKNKIEITIQKGRAVIFILC